jgi:hypothetical protein
MTEPAEGLRSSDCQHPGCGVPIEEMPPTFPGGAPFWMHVEPVPDGFPKHPATPVEQQEPVRVRCPGLGCGGPAWRMPDGAVYCPQTRQIVPEPSELVPGSPYCWDCKGELSFQPDHAPCGATGCQCWCQAPVRPWHIAAMAERLCDAVRERSDAVRLGMGSPKYRLAVRAQGRRRKALERLAEALARQPGGAR